MGLFVSPTPAQLYVCNIGIDKKDHTCSRVRQLTMFGNLCFKSIHFTKVIMKLPNIISMNSYWRSCERANVDVGFKRANDFNAMGMSDMAKDINEHPLLKAS